MSKRYQLKATLYDKRGRPLSTGQNSYKKTHPLQAKFAKLYGRSDEQIFLHAEIAALVKLKDWSKAYRIKVERYDFNGRPVNAKPCKICQAALDEAGIKVIEHT
ncbi:hypothetical protein N9Z41_02705 [bacterium]|nr:hypothetical protein [bacterium]